MQREGDLRWEIRFRNINDSHVSSFLKKEVKQARLDKIRRTLEENDQYKTIKFGRNLYTVQQM